MSDNVIILGAGFSRAAGVPLMGEFVDTMWDISMRKSCRGKALSEADAAIFEKAYQVRNKLDGYHGRANFDDRNIEDILSILAFEVLAGDPDAKEKLQDVNSAIARTIELTCEVRHAGISADGSFSISDKGVIELYRNFWRSLFNWEASGKQIPTIITFNYDLVLERSLLQFFIGTSAVDGGLRPNYLSLKYHFENVPDQFYEICNKSFLDTSSEAPAYRACTILKKADITGASRQINLEILKLHGSVNFPSEKVKDAMTYNIAEALHTPAILAPVFNKFSGTTVNSTWKIAMQRLRAAKNVLIVGYSLPKTDIYMQYFLKAALGPNIPFNRLFVYDPVLHFDRVGGKEMKRRYEESFSPQLKSRIIFDPPSYLSSKDDVALRGTTNDFILTLFKDPDSILF